MNYKYENIISEKEIKEIEEIEYCIVSDYNEEFLVKKNIIIEAFGSIFEPYEQEKVIYVY